MFVYSDIKSIIIFISGTIFGGLVTYCFDMLKQHKADKKNNKSAYLIVSTQLDVINNILHDDIKNYQSLSDLLDNLIKAPELKDLSDLKIKHLKNIVSMISKRENSLKNLSYENQTEIKKFNDDIINLINDF